MKDQNEPRVFTVPLRKRKDVEADYVCCYVAGTIEAGHSKLKLTATEGEQTYGIELTSDAIRHSKHPKVEESGERYEQLLLDCFSGKFVKDIEFIADIQSDTIELFLQKIVYGVSRNRIEVTLGSIVIPATDEEISLMDWLNVSYHSMRENRANLDNAEAKRRELEAALEQLQNSMDVLVRAKTQHDTEMLTNFASLLNAKKAKIRELSGLGGTQSKSSKKQKLRSPSESSDEASPLEAEVDEDMSPVDDVHEDKSTVTPSQDSNAEDDEDEEL